jgi:hypothetical protein
MPLELIALGVNAESLIWLPVIEKSALFENRLIE